jgi:diguanylate cyclase (GGDEF)-like protein
LFIAAAVTIMFYAFSVIVKSEQVAVFWRGMYFAATDWLVLVLLNYTKKYTDVKGKHIPVRVLMYLGAAVDTVSMIVNVFTKHVFVCERCTTPGWENCYKVVPTYLPNGTRVYAIHLFFVYGLAVLVMTIIVHKTIHAVRLYRGKYTAVLWSFVVVLAGNVGYRFVNSPIDISPILYSLLAVSSAYFSLFYVPKSIVVKLLSLSVEDMESGILCFDRDGKCVYANGKSRDIFDAHESLEQAEQYYADWKSVRTEEELREESWKEKRELDGEIHTFEVRFRFLLDDRGSYVGSFFSIVDRTADYQALEYEQYKATHDNLTDIYNRERFFERVEEQLQQNPDTKWVIVCIDVKDFKGVNDLFGEETGNRILKRIAGLMRRDAHEDTLYGRLEADRFAMYMREENFIEGNYTEYLEDLKRIIHSSVYRMHVHVGVYHIIDRSMSISVMCDKAFMAIRSIKENYQQIVAYYSEDMGHDLQREKVMVGEFDRALAAGEFQMYLQPQVAVDNHGILGAEALVRWDHPVRGMIPPSEFIPVFEKSGYIPRLDRYMWELACRQLRKWKDEGRENLHISVNISPKDFYFVDIYETFTSLVERYGVSPTNLKLEITETALMEEVSKQMDLLRRLRDYGFHVEIDDFGSGYSSLNTLKDIEVDVLKLDMGFLRQTSHEERSKTIMNAVINMSKNLGLTVVTEGVETAEQVAYLTEAGCDVFQGYYFARPMPVTEFESKYFVK